MACDRRITTGRPGDGITTSRLSSDSSPEAKSPKNVSEQGFLKIENTSGVGHFLKISLKPAQLIIVRTSLKRNLEKLANPRGILNFEKSLLGGILGNFWLQPA